MYTCRIRRENGRTVLDIPHAASAAYGIYQGQSARILPDNDGKQGWKIVPVEATREESKVMRAAREVRAQNGELFEKLARM